MVRYPERERLSVENLNDMRVRTPAGDEVPFATVAEVSYRPGYLAIDRLDRKRTLKVTADVVMGLADPRAVVDEVHGVGYADCLCLDGHPFPFVFSAPVGINGGTLWCDGCHFWSRYF